MSAFRVNVVAVNPKNEDVVTEPISALVDTGSELTWLPAGDLSAIGITPRRKRTFVTASGDRLQREVGYAIVRAEGYETTDEVVFGVKATRCCWAYVRWKVSLLPSTPSATDWSRRLRSRASPARKPAAPATRDWSE